MCGRFKLSRFDKAELAERLGIKVSEIPDYADEVDNAPGSMRSVIEEENGERKWSAMRWGFVAEIAGRKQMVFNAKAENMNIPRWRALLGNRCIIPASAFFEWEKIGGKSGAKYEITAPGEPVFGFAAIYDNLRSPKTGEMERTFWIITTAPNRSFAALHNRQPVILDRSDYDEWLTGKARPLHLLRVLPEEKMLITKVADAAEPKARRGRVTNNEPSYHKSDQPGLFD